MTEGLKVAWVLLNEGPWIFRNSSVQIPSISTIIPQFSIWCQNLEYCYSPWNQTPAKLQSASTIDGLVQNCSNSSAKAMELLQFCTKKMVLACNHCRAFISIADCLSCLYLHDVINIIHVNDAMQYFLFYNHHIDCLAATAFTPVQWSYCSLALSLWHQLITMTQTLLGRSSS